MGNGREFLPGHRQPQQTQQIFPLTKSTRLRTRGRQRQPSLSHTTIRFIPLLPIPVSGGKTAGRFLRCPGFPGPAASRPSGQPSAYLPLKRLPRQNPEVHRILPYIYLIKCDFRPFFLASKTGNSSKRVYLFLYLNIYLFRFLRISVKIQVFSEKRALFADLLMVTTL